MNSLSTYAKANGGSFSALKPPSAVVDTNAAATNPSIVYYKGKRYINQRVVDYTLMFSNERFELYSNGPSQYIYLGGDDVRYTSRNYITDTETGEEREILFPTHFTTKYSGLEDARFVVWGDRLYMYGTRLDIYYGQANICIYLIDTDTFTVERGWIVKNWPLNGVETLESPNWAAQKNWMAIPDRPFHFIYTPSPAIEVRVDPDDCSYSLASPLSHDNLSYSVRGSAPLCRIDNNTYLALVHTNNGGFDENGMPQTRYMFKALLYDNWFNVKKESEWFVFMNEMTEFCCGMCINDGKIAFAHSSFDSSSYLTELELGKFMDFMDKKGDEHNFFDERFMYTTAVGLEKEGLNAIPWFNHIACTVKQTEPIHYESAVRVLAFWLLNDSFVRQCFDNLHFLAYKYTKLFPDRCEAYYILSMLESLNGDLEKAAELKSRADCVRDGDRSVIDRYLQPHYM